MEDKEENKDIIRLEPHPPPSTPTRLRIPSSSVVTPRAIRTSLAKSPEIGAPKGIAEKSSQKKTPRSSNSAKPPSTFNVKYSDNPLTGTRKPLPRDPHVKKVSKLPLTNS